MLYNIGIRLYHLGVVLASLFNSKAKLWVEGRKGMIEQIEATTSGFQGETLWVHVASLGEFEMARPIMEQLKNSEPRLRIILTFFSPSGYEVRKNYRSADHVFYLPLDTPSNAKRFVKTIKPTKVIFVKYDLWFHYLKQAKLFGAKLMLISAQFRPEQPYFKFYGSVGKQALGFFDQIFVVDQNSVALLSAIGITHVQVCGDTRYDRVMEMARSEEKLETIEKFKGESNLVVCGSTWTEDIELISKCVTRFSNTKWIIAPHEVGEDNISRLEKQLSQTTRYSKFNEDDSLVLIIDSIGLLNKIYRYADVAYVGGGFRTGLHNIFEATAYGVPTVFGPDTSRFPDAEELAMKGLAFKVKNEKQFEAMVNQLLAEDQIDLKAKIQSFMQSRTGATQTILQYTEHC